ncbi:hypothetical protein D5R95_00935 [Methanosalsum natronophilum]|uniref:Uncharacterized protein n=2 Tax=Methanosalsum natronophilum TaxID=768733 RepID=A0A424Z464_9EURY|nr:MAG: hypothetical protein D5R95_00935 [Methanosalsum natronophilum]
MTMKYIEYYLSILTFFLVLAIAYLIGNALNITWLMFYSFASTSTSGFVFEAGISWIPIIFALIISYIAWKYEFTRLYY